MAEAAASGTIAPLNARQMDLLAGEYSNMLACVRCGLCLTACPTYVLSGHEAESPRGRVALMRGVYEGRFPLTIDILQHESTCLVCDACTAVCPAGVHMDPLQVALRAATLPQTPISATQRLLRDTVLHQVFPHLEVLRAIVRALWVYQRSGVQSLVRRLGLLRLLGLAEVEALAPSVAREFLVPRGETYLAAGTSEAPPVAALFAGCIMSTALADIDRATIRVFQRAGFTVVNTAGQGCCGALNAHSGDLATAKALAQRNIASFEHEGTAPIIVNSAGCGAMLKDYGRYFEDAPGWSERARAFAARVRDSSELLVGRPLPLGQPVATKLTYQDACHLAQAQKITAQPRALLAAIPGASVTEMRESTLCCGSAGIYNVTNPDTARQLQQRKLDNALATGADTIVTANPGCLFQLECGLRERGSNVRVRHIMDVLDEATTPAFGQGASRAPLGAARE